MRQRAYPAALGGCVLGAATLPVRAAEWSIIPSYSAQVDYDTNRRLAVERKGSEATVLAIDVKFKRALEDLELTFEPRYVLRRFTDRSLGNGDDRTVNSALAWTGERSTLNLTASYLDQSTLLTEQLETGLVSGDTHRRQSQAGATWNWGLTERRVLITQLNFVHVNYYGQEAFLLPGYRYPSGSLGERFQFNERGYLTVSAYGSVLSSKARGNSSHEIGAQAEVNYSFSERTNIDASLGRSSRVLNGSSNPGTVGSVALSHSFLLGKITFSYARNLVPYGTGFLVEQQQYNATLLRSLTPYLDTTVSFLRIRNNQTAVLLRIDRLSYNSVAAGLNWHPAETWSVGARLEGVRTQLFGSVGRNVSAVRSYLSVTWSPFPKSRSW